jgi:DNA-directed RNA polymerase subunit RPC12/RpoP
MMRNCAICGKVIKNNRDDVDVYCKDCWDKHVIPYKSN